MSDKIATVEYIHDNICNDIFYANTYKPNDKIPTREEIESCALLKVNGTYESNQCVKESDISKQSIIIPVTINESVVGESKLDSVEIWLVDMTTMTGIQQIGYWACGSVDGSKSANIVCNIPDNVVTTGRHCLSIYCGKTGAKRKFTFSAKFPSFTISNSYTGIRERWWYAPESSSQKGLLTVNHPGWTWQAGVGPAASVIGGPGVEKLQRITITISN